MLLDIHEPGETPLPHQGAASIGIDLGTTNSLVAISNKGLQEVISDEKGNSLVPSVVFYDEDDKAIVGIEADKHDNSIRSIKRLMGRSLEDVNSLGEQLPFEVDETKKEGLVRIKVNNKSLTPIEISAEILKELKLRAEESLENEVDRAVITVPAYFDDAARAATKDAAKLAGLEVLRLVNEPTAAALAYGLDKEAEGIYAVYDLGGGTFDISILKMEKGVFQVLATGGNTALGGDDFDHKIAQYFLEQAGEPELSQQDVHVLLKTAKLAKEELTEKEVGSWSINISGKDVECKLDKETLNSLISPLVDITLDISKSVFEDSKIGIDNVKGVVMVGGSTRVPLVREKVKELLNRDPLTDVDPDKVVAIGAAIQAESLTQGSDNLLLDVTPLSLGIETMGELVEVLIPRNTPIPASHSQKFTTYQDGQTGLKIHVLQGEREMVDSCRSLAQFELLGIPPMQAGAAIIEVTFTIDADGLLTVSAREETTAVEQKIEVKPSYGLPAEKIEEMLKESMENAKKDITRKLLAESKIDAKRAIISVETALNEDGDMLEKEKYGALEKQIALINELIEGSDREAIDFEVSQLEKMYSPFADIRVNNALGSLLKGKGVNKIEEKLDN